MTVLLISSMLLDAGAVKFDSGDLEGLSLHIQKACQTGPRRPPQGRDCYAAVIAVWSTETRRNFTLYPPNNGTGLGPMQIIPRARWGNSRLGYWSTPPPEVLRWHLPTNFAWGVLVLRAKRMKVRRWRSMFRDYNGSSRRESYADKALRTFRRLK